MLWRAVMRPDALLLLVFCAAAARAQTTLFDLVGPNARTRVFDTLSAAVDSAYARQPVQFDWSQMIAFGAKPISIPTVNEGYRAVLYDGDMVLSERQLQRIADNMADADRSRHKRKAFRDSQYPATIWQHGVPFELHESLPIRARLSVRHAIQFWQDNTCIPFRQRTTESSYLQFVGYENGCWSTVGRDDSTPTQIISIGKGCEHVKHILLCCVLRSVCAVRRDVARAGARARRLPRAVAVRPRRARPPQQGRRRPVAAVQLCTSATFRRRLVTSPQVGPLELDTYDLPYDVGSVMHYAPTEFSRSRLLPALTTVDPFLQQSMGSMDKPSFLDVLAMNLHYKCHERCATPLPCRNGGYTDPRSCASCKCPDGYGGALCDVVQASFSEHCGGYINTTDSVRKFEISITQTGNVLKDKICIYHIRAPAGKRVLLNLMTLTGTCVEGCYIDGVELKMKADKRPVGYRFCCAESQLRRLVSEGSEVPLLVFTRHARVKMVFEYTHVERQIANDAPPLTKDDLARLDDYEPLHVQRQERLGLFARISTSKRRQKW